MTAPVSALAAIRSGLLLGLRRAFSAVVWFVLLCISGAALLVAGAFILAGLGWATVVAGALCLVIAVLLLVGMSRG